MANYQHIKVPGEGERIEARAGEVVVPSRPIVPFIEGEGNSRDIDFTASGIRTRWKAGYDDTSRALEIKPWEAEVDPMDGVAVHNCEPAVLSNP